MGLLYDELSARLQPRADAEAPGGWLLEEAGGEGPRFQLRSGTWLHLYVSEPPCGDAAIFELAPDAAAAAVAAAAAAPAAAAPAAAAAAPAGATTATALPTEAGGSILNFTGAKRLKLRGDCTTPGGDGFYSDGLRGAGGSASAGAGDDDETEREPGAQALGCCRLKSCRSDVAGGNRTFSHCCSDKIVRWSVEGCQGALLRRWVRPLRFAKVVLSHDPRAASLNALLAAASRAIVARAATAAAALRSASLRASRGAPDPFRLPEVAVVAAPFSHSFHQRLAECRAALGLRHVRDAHFDTQS